MHPLPYGTKESIPAARSVTPAIPAAARNTLFRPNVSDRYPVAREPRSVPAKKSVCARVRIWDREQVRPKRETRLF